VETGGGKKNHAELERRKKQRRNGKVQEVMEKRKNAKNHARRDGCKK